jgi:hypothetical protein
MACGGVVYGTTAQYCALGPCSSDFKTCDVLWGEVVRPLPNPKPGGPGLCIYDPWRLGIQDVPLGTG